MTLNPVRLFLRNPVVLKELRGRMRGPRAFVVLTGYLLLVGGFTILLYLVMSTASEATAGQIDGGEIGRNLFAGVVGIQLFLVTFIAPAFTSGSISGERERQTYDLLRTTLLPEANLVMGKLFSALAYIFLLLLSTIPLQSLSFILGGTDLPDMIIATVILMVTAILLGTAGTYFSARLRRTLPASIATYGAALTLVIGTGLLLVILASIESILFDGADVSPAVEWGFLIGLGIFVSLNPIATLVLTREYLINQQSVFTFSHEFADQSTVTLPSPWIVFIVLYLLIAAALFWLTTRRIKQVDEF